MSDIKSVERNVFKWFWTAIAFCALIYALSGCTPQKKLHRLIKKHPELVRTDTIWQTHIDTIPEIYVNTVFMTDTSTSQLDSIFRAYQGKIDSTLAIRMKGEIRNYIVNRPFLPDTLTQTKDGVTVKIFQNGNNIGVIVHRDEELIPVSVPVTTVTVAPPATDKIRDIENKLLIGILILFLLFILFLIGRFFVKRLLTKIP